MFRAEHSPWILERSNQPRKLTDVPQGTSVEIFLKSRLVIFNFNRNAQVTILH